MPPVQMRVRMMAATPWAVAVGEAPYRKAPYRKAPCKMARGPHLIQLHCFRGHVEGGALVVVGHVGAARVQQLAQPKVCKVAGWGGGGAPAQGLSRSEDW